MRLLCPLERAVLGAVARAYPGSTRAIERQSATARVTHFENSGVGFFSNLTVDPDETLITGPTPLDAGHGWVDGVQELMGFLVFLEGGRLSMIEGYCYAGGTEGLNFANAAFQLIPLERLPNP